ncbi:substrate-binding domain-containing protein [Xanthomarina sp. F2636L]|uniref:substrate-binding domain-containing protein n=1 Tax=Xanthomarina sp. F2636L TaxID=2996018 RepID=UPI00225E26EA|nr:substrate-binding domain-containing protein [Xanthomarina sp. F2636L]MCX7549693.1 substrate-binding domain-containing protein [Xanthomarina sp. F2636L]
MKTIHIGGVPEHFNLAWYLALKQGEFKKAGINLRWKDYPSGTGAMSKSLRKGEIDLSVILTEGIIKDIVEGNPSKIIQTFVQTPLIWGIHVAQNSNYKTIEDLKASKAAISRYGSGSHLMAYINAQNNGWDLDTDLHFEVIKDLDGAVEGLTERKADYFLWEKFMTKPLVDQGVFRRIGECPTPWPCFVIAARDESLREHHEEIKIILEIINNNTKNFKNIPEIDKIIAKRYNQKIADVQEWLSLTEWSQDTINKESIDNIQEQLLALNIISTKKDYKHLITEI